VTRALDLGAWERRVVAVSLFVTAVVMSSYLPSVRFRTDVYAGWPWSHSATQQQLRSQLSFVPNRGQVDARVRYHAQDGGATLWFTRKQAVFAVPGTDRGAVVALRFLRANPEASVVAAGKATATVNYLTGPASSWRTGLPTYRRLVYRDLWPGTDLRFDGRGGTLRYELRLTPGTDPSRIRMAYRGAESLSLDRGGNLVIDTPAGAVTDSHPIAYQVVGGRRIPVMSAYTVAGRRFGFVLGPYDHTRPLVIDPEVVYSTFLGGAAMDQGKAVAVDASGNAYVAGLTASADFPASTGAYDLSRGGFEDAFVTKLNADGSAVVYSTYLGGSGADEAYGLALDPSGDAYVTGLTGSADFPTTSGAVQSALHGPVDAFVTKLNPDGSGVLYSTLLGGTGVDFANAIAVDSAGSAYLAGDSRSDNFPTTVGSYDTSYADGFDDAFAAKLNRDGSALVYSTYLGGSFGDDALGVALDAGGNAYVTGFTTSEDYPVTDGVYDPFFNGRADAFVTKLNAAGSDPVYSTFLGGSMRDDGFGISVDGSGSAYVTGDSGSGDFPATAGSSDTSLNGGTDAFVAKLDAAGSDVVYSTYVGGISNDQGQGLAVQSDGTVFVTGTTSSPDYPSTADAYDGSLGGGSDAFVTEVDAAGSALVYSSFLGGSSTDAGSRIAVGGPDEAFVTGYTVSTDYPTTEGVTDASLGGSADAFVTKLGSAGVVDPPPPAQSPPAAVTLSPAAGTDTVGTTHTVTANVTDSSGDPVSGVVVPVTVTGSVTTSAQCTTDDAGQCSVTYGGPQLPGADSIAAFADTNQNGTQDSDEPGASANETWVLPDSTPGWVHANGHLRTDQGHRVTLAELAASDGSQSRGMCVVVDHTARRWLKCQSVTAFVQSGHSVTVYGAALDGGLSTTYVIHAVDGGKPGRGLDTFSIETTSGFSVSGTLDGGRVHCKNLGPRRVGHEAAHTTKR
jgi:Beta-propeller repeat